MALVELRVRGIAVLDDAVLEPGKALVALTGETGSGKSLCMTALRAVLGGRADASLVRAGRDLAVVTAVFDDVPAAVRERLHGLGIADDDLLTLVRELPRSGRGACRVNGALVSLSVLREVGEELVEVTVQGESHRLLRPARQRQLLDAFGGAGIRDARDRVAAAVALRRDARTALDTARGAQTRSEADVEHAREVIAELEALGLRVGEDTTLRGERDRLRHAVELAAAAQSVHDACAGVDDAAGAADVVAAAGAEALSLASVDAEVGALATECDDLVERLRDLGRRAAALATGYDVDGARLEAVEERLDAVERARRRHGGSVEAALGALDRARRLVADADGGGDRLRHLEDAVASADRDAAEAAAVLGGHRATAAARLERAVTARLRHLRLPHARFRIVLSSVPDPDGVEVDGRRVACTAEGADVVEMRLAADRDGVPLPLDQGVSGGELSRLALALRSVVALADDSPTLVLDEVDTGVGGDTAARVGETLAAIGSERQVLVITHRPEIAARAASHLVVVKSDGAGGATATVSAVDGRARVEEVARLMSGSPTDAARARARELLDDGAEASVRGAARTIAPR